MAFSFPQSELDSVSEIQLSVNGGIQHHLHSSATQFHILVISAVVVRVYFLYLTDLKDLAFVKMHQVVSPCTPLLTHCIRIYQEFQLHAPKGTQVYR